MRDDSFHESESEAIAPPSIWRGRAATGAGAVISLVILAGLVTWSYRLGVRDASDIPVIRAELEATKVRPDEPGGEQVAHQDRAVYGAIAGADGETTTKTGFAEAPARLADEDVAPVAGAPAPVGRPPQPIEADAALVGEPASEPASETANETVSEPSTDVTAAPDDAADPAPVEGETTATPETSDSEIAAAEEAISDVVAPDPIDEVDALVQAALAEGAAEGAAASGPAPRRAPSARPRPTRVAARSGPGGEAAEPRAAASASKIQIQLGAFVSENVAAVEWAAIKSRNGDLLGGRGRVITPVTSGGRQLFRLRAGPFETVEQASALCRGLQKRDEACIVARAQ